jgi:two-component system, LytTR family, response regulator
VERPVRTLVADGEKPARQRLVTLLRRRPDIELLGECRDAEALRRILTDASVSRARIDLLFLDVQLPGMNGVDLLDALRRGSPDSVQVVVFVTADDTHAERALHNGAADYVLKPFSDERIGMALQRALRLVDSRRIHANGGRADTDGV